MKKLCTVLSILMIMTCVSATQANGNLTVAINALDRTIEGKSYVIKSAQFSKPSISMKYRAINVIKAKPFDGCSTIPTPDIELIQSHLPIFILVDGKDGKCGYRQKSQMVSETGAKGVIIVNDNFTQNDAPSSKFTDGSFIVLLIGGGFDPEKVGDQFNAYISISDVPPDHNLQIWISALNAKSYQILSLFTQIIHQVPAIKKKVTWQPRFVFSGCYDTACRESAVSSCACGRLFCSPQVYGKTPDIVIKEDIRQKIIFKINDIQFLNYTEMFKAKCFNRYLQDLQIESCSQSIMNQLKINFVEVEKQMKQMIEMCEGAIFQSSMQDKGAFRSIGEYPTIRLDRYILEFTNQAELKREMCSALKLQNEPGCKTQQTSGVWIKVILGFIGLIAIGACMFLKLRKKLSNDIQRQIRMKVQTAVEQYYTLNEHP